MRPAPLPPTGTCDLTTTGRRTGRARTVEIWFVVVDGAPHIVGTPGGRDWLANVRADENVSISFEGNEAQYRAHEVIDAAERAHVARSAWRAQPWYAQQGHTVQDWVDRSPMVKLTPA